MDKSTRSLLLGGSILLLVLLAVAVPVAISRQGAKDRQERPSDTPASAAFAPETSVTPAASSSLTAEQVYNCLHTGMTEAQMRAACGPPDSDEKTMRPGVYGLGSGDNPIREEEQATVDAAAPAGRGDDGETRQVIYQRNGHRVIVLLIGTVDTSHPDTQQQAGEPVWAVYQYFLR
jgi:hypothetical protein